jgi:anti-sigma factor RsiW
MQHLDAELAHSLVRATLPPADAAAWEQHLRGCERCRRLVADERSWSNLLKLEQRDNSSVAAASERMLPRLEALVPGQARRMRQRRIAILIGSGLCAVTAVAAIVWRLATPTAAQRSAAELGIPEAVQARIVENLAAWQALRRDPWLPDELVTVETFEKSLRAERETMP